MDIKNINPQEILRKFRFSMEGRAEFSEVDSYEVVHNLRYLYWFEASRVEYIGAVGIELTPNTIAVDVPLMVVKTEVNYFTPIRFTEKYKVLCRVASIGNSSLVFENIALNSKGEISAAASAVLVHLDKPSLSSKRIPDKIRQMIIDYEGSNINVKN